jgi:serine protease inhibitor
MKQKACLLIMAATIFSCEKNPGEQLGPREIIISKTTGDIIRSDNAFGLELFQQAAACDTEATNLFISPTSVSLALAMTYNGADGETKTAMENALKKQGFSIDEINTSYKSLINALVSIDPRVTLEIANSIWYREDFTVLPDFISINQEYYDAQVKSLDFDSPGAPGVINDWVSAKTHERITTIIEQIPAQAVMYLINAIYFKGIWKSEFDEASTTDGSFYLPDGSLVKVPVMKQTTALRLTSNELFSMVELPYGQGNFSMLVLLPLAGHSPDDIIHELAPEKWDEWTGSLEETNVTLHLPRFSYSYRNELNDELEAMGMGIVFTGEADFSKINGTGDLLISKVLHKSFVEVNEEGTEAAAVTSVEVELTAFPGNVMFNVNRPFLFAIREIKTGTILFIGMVRNPLVKENG